MEFIDACAAQDIAAGKGRALRIRGKDIALFNVDGTFHAIENSCLHQGAALSNGRLAGHFVSCPAHGWRFDLTTGLLKNSQTMGVACFPVQIADGHVQIGLTTDCDTDAIAGVCAEQKIASTVSACAQKCHA